MKKLLLVAASTALISSASFAEEGAFYFRGDVGVSHFQAEKDKATKLKVKTDHSPLFSIGVGYGIMDGVRGELELGHHFEPELSKSGKVNGVDASSKHKVKATSLMVKAIADIFDAGPAKIFAGAGVGMVKLSDKVTYKDAAGEKNFKVKSKNNVAFTVLAGAGFEASPGVNFDLTYSYNNYGQTKSYKDKNINAGEESGKLRVHGHMIKGGVRFAI